MSFPRTWVEELVAELLQREGFLVETGLPIKIPKKARAGGKGGGRYEADVIGAKFDSGNLKIIHVETGALIDKNMVERISQKYSPHICGVIKKRYADKFNVPLQKIADYEKLCLVTYPHEKEALWSDWKSEIYKKDERIQVERLTTFIEQRVLPSLPKSYESTLPEGSWLLCLLFYLKDYSVAGFGEREATSPRRPARPVPV